MSTNPRPVDRNWAIYVLEDPRTGGVRYVGWTTNEKRRLRRHINDTRTAKGNLVHSQRWIASLLADGLKPAMRIIETGFGGEWQEREKFWIALYRSNGASLTNITSGGDGACGVKKTEDEKRAMGMRTKARLGAMSAEERRAVSVKAWNELSEEARQKFFAGGLHSLPPEERRNVAVKREASLGAEKRSRRATSREAAMSTESKRKRALRMYESRIARAISNNEPVSKPETKLRSSNKTGYPGVYHYRYLPGRFSGAISIDGKLRHCGVFDTPHEAYMAVLSVAKENGKEYFSAIPVDPSRMVA